MPVIYNDFFNTLAGQAPSGWTQRFPTTAGFATTTVESVVDTIDGKALKIAAGPSTSNNEHLVTLDAPSSVYDGEIVARVRGTTTDRTPKVAFRYNGVTNPRYGYWVGLSSTNIALQKINYNSITNVQLVPFAGTFSAANWYNIRVRFVGSSIKARVWQDGTAEPDTWAIDATDATVSSGWVGIYTTVSSVETGQYVDAWAIDTDGASPSIDLPGMNYALVSSCDVSASSPTILSNAVFVAAPSCSVQADMPTPSIRTPRTYYTNFSEYASGQQPSGWTPRFLTSNQTWQVIDSADAIGGKLLQHTTSTTSNGLRMLSYDTIDADPFRADCDVVSRIRVSQNTVGADSVPSLMIRASGTTAANASGYQLVISPATLATSFGTVTLCRWNAGGRTSLSSFSFQVDNDKWYLVRFRAVGNVISCKIWPESQPEPKWNLTYTDASAILTPGFIGPTLYSYSGAHQWDFVSIATDALEAPIQEYATSTSTRYYTDFSDTAVGQIPVGWTNRSPAGSGPWVVKEQSGSIGGKVLDNSAATTNGIFAFTCDKLDNTRDVDIVARVRSTNTNAYSPYIAARVTNTGTSVSGYGAGIVGGALEICYFSNGSRYRISNINVNSIDGQWYIIRLRIMGNLLQAKAWPETQSEPVGWLLESADTLYTNGFAGIITLNSGNVRMIDFVSAAIVGDNPTGIPISAISTAPCLNVTTQVELPAGLVINGTFETDFSEYATGEKPSDWLEIWTTTAPIAIVEDASATGGKVLRRTSSVVGNHYMSWSKLNSSGDTIEYLCRVKACSNAAPNLFLRAHGSVSYPYAYYLQPLNANTTSGYYYGGAAYGLTSRAQSIVVGQWYWVRYRLEQNSGRYKVWPDGQQEPGVWTTFSMGNETHISAMSQTLETWNGFQTYFGVAGATQDFDYIKIANDGTSPALPDWYQGKSQFFTNFSEYAVDATPSDWQSRWNTTDAFKIVALASASDGKALAITPTTSGWRTQAWAKLDNVSDFESVTRWMSTTQNASNVPILVSRSSGNASYPNGYMVSVYNKTTLQFIKAASGNVTIPFSVSIPEVLANTWHWTRFNVSGNVLKAKIWRDGENEPVAWTITYTDASSPISATNSGCGVGISSAGSGTVYYDVFGAGINGAVAPTNSGYVHISPPVIECAGESRTATIVSTDSLNNSVAYNTTIDMPNPLIITPGQFFTDFSSYVTGSAPNDWTAAWNATNSVWSIVDMADATGGKALKHVATSTGLRMFKWNRVPSASTFEVVGRVRSNASTSYDWPVFWVRSKDSQTAYFLYISPGQYFQIRELIDGTAYYLVNNGALFNNNTWYWVRFRVEGKNLFAKIWADGANEPTAWTANATDNAVPIATDFGYFGLGAQTLTGERYYDVVGVAVDGPAAPKTLSETLATPCTITVSGAAVISLSGVMPKVYPAGIITEVPMACRASAISYAPEVIGENGIAVHVSTQAVPLLASAAGVIPSLTVDRTITTAVTTFESSVTTYSPLILMDSDTSAQAPCMEASARTPDPAVFNGVSIKIAPDVMQVDAMLSSSDLSTSSRTVAVSMGVDIELVLPAKVPLAPSVVIDATWAGVESQLNAPNLSLGVRTIAAEMTLNMAAQAPAINTSVSAKVQAAFMAASVKFETPTLDLQYGTSVQPFSVLYSWKAFSPKLSFAYTFQMPTMDAQLAAPQSVIRAKRYGRVITNNRGIDTSEERHAIEYSPTTKYVKYRQVVIGDTPLLIPQPIEQPEVIQPSSMASTIQSMILTRQRLDELLQKAEQQMASHVVQIDVEKEPHISEAIKRYCTLNQNPDRIIYNDDKINFSMVKKAVEGGSSQEWLIAERFMETMRGLFGTSAGDLWTILRAMKDDMSSYINFMFDLNGVPNGVDEAVRLQMLNSSSSVSGPIEDFRQAAQAKADETSPLLDQIDYVLGATVSDSVGNMVCCFLKKIFKNITAEIPDNVRRQWIELSSKYADVNERMQAASNELKSYRAQVEQAIDQIDQIIAKIKVLLAFRYERRAEATVFIENKINKVIDKSLNSIRQQLAQNLTRIKQSVNEPVIKWLDKMVADEEESCLPMEMLASFIMDSVEDIEDYYTKQILDQFRSDKFHVKLLQEGIESVQDKKRLRDMYTLLDLLQQNLDSARSWTLKGQLDQWFLEFINSNNLNKTYDRVTQTVNEVTENIDCEGLLEMLLGG